MVKIDGEEAEADGAGREAPAEESLREVDHHNHLDPVAP